VGRTVTATAQVTEIGDRLIRFEVEAHDGIEKIGSGSHVRAAIDLGRFEQRMAAKRLAKPAS
jgi:fluoroacetyl-CoA thioesterase